MTSVEAVTGRRPVLEEVGTRVIEHFCQVFDRQPAPVEPRMISNPWPITI